MSRVIGLSGLAQSGKDTCAGYMKGFKRLAFADALKQTLYDLNPIVHVVDRGSGHRQKFWTLQELVDSIGWEEAKTRGDVRPQLQRLGVAVREHVAQEAWVVAVMGQMYEGTDYVITDVRFPNEYQAIQRQGGEVWRVERPGIVAPNAHISERALDGFSFDQVVENNGTLDDLEAQVAELLSVAAI